MKHIRNKSIRLIIIFSIGLLAAVFCQFLAKQPSSQHIHIRNFRYGKDPSSIRCNRGDTLLLTFSTDDTGHSFFLEEFNVDVKVSPARNDVSVFKTDDPTNPPLITDTVVVVARHQGILNFLISKSMYRCHVWCGPMHAFEQGKLVIFPNTLLFFSMGCLLGIVLLWLIALFSGQTPVHGNKRIDLLQKYPRLKRLLTSRLPQITIMLLALVMMYIVIITGAFGTKMSGRNLGVLLMWAVWLFILVALLTPLFGRSWCTICPLPFFGDWLQRGSLFSPQRGKTKGYNNRYLGWFLKWPDKLKNGWLRLFFFLLLSTFSTTLVAKPSVSALTVLLLLLIPTLMSVIWRKRAFCRYLCPVSVFVSPFAGMGMVAIQPKEQNKCDNCKAHFCEKGSAGGWACPYGLNVGKMKESNECGLCLECLRSCSYNNVTLTKRNFGQSAAVNSISEAWLAIAIFTTAILYSVIYLGTWTAIRDYVNILDKQNWDLFGIYALSVWILLLILLPGILFFAAHLATKMARVSIRARAVFMEYCSLLIPLGMMLWIAFVIPMLFVNITFIQQSFSDPLGWGWDFFGTANIPWHQFLPQYIPWLQSIFILWGFNLSLRNLSKKWLDKQLSKNKKYCYQFQLCSFF